MLATSGNTGSMRTLLATRVVGTLSLMVIMALMMLAALTPRLALADDEDDEVAATASRVEQANDSYVAATEHLAEVQQQMVDNMEHISEIEAQLPVQRERTADSIRTLYKLQQSSGSLIDLVLSSESFSTLLSTLQYLNIISERNSLEVTNLATLSMELNAAQTSLEAQRVEAENAQAEAQAALFAAEEARTEAQQRAIARAMAEEAEAAAALEAARAAAEQEQTFTTASGNTAQVVVSDQPAGTAEVTHDDTAEASDGGGDSGDNADEQGGAEEAAPVSGSVDDWAARIDAYLAGSPLEGQGRTFAVAALTYGVDPRWSPAISCIESSKGWNCFREHNAWGWGQASWGSWEEAINAHVAGLAAGYGYSITVWAAQKYCPPNWEFWYSAVSSEMGRI